MGDFNLYVLVGFIGLGIVWFSLYISKHSSQLNCCLPRSRRGMVNIPGIAVTGTSNLKRPLASVQFNFVHCHKRYWVNMIFHNLMSKKLSQTLTSHGLVWTGLVWHGGLIYGRCATEWNPTLNHTISRFIIYTRHFTFSFCEFYLVCSVLTFCLPSCLFNSFQESNIYVKLNKTLCLRENTFPSILIIKEFIIFNSKGTS